MSFAFTLISEECRFYVYFKKKIVIESGDFALGEVFVFGFVFVR